MCARIFLLSAMYYYVCAYGGATLSYFGLLCSSYLHFVVVGFPLLRGIAIVVFVWYVFGVRVFVCACVHVYVCALRAGLAHAQAAATTDLGVVVWCGVVLWAAFALVSGAR